jgi:hypothetical protein
MAKTKLRGLLNLSKIDKSLIVKNKNNESCIWVDILENLSGPDQYGNTHTMTTYNKDTRTTTYLGNFKPQEFGKAAASASHDEAATDDLPFD